MNSGSYFDSQSSHSSCNRPNSCVACVKPAGASATGRFLVPSSASSLTVASRAGSWGTQRRVAARIEATRLGLDIRYVVTYIMTGTAEWLYAELYCQRGQAENLIKLHKAQVASDRTSCGAATANQMRLVLHTPATGSASPFARRSPRRTRSPWPSLLTTGGRLLKIAARVTESASRVRLAFAAACPDAALFRQIAAELRPTPS